MSVQPFKGSLERLTLKNNNYRKVIHTNKVQQLVLMSLQPLEEIGMEVHPHTSQFLRIEAGSGYVVLNGQVRKLKDGDAVVVPPGTEHNVVAGKQGLKLYTIYCPPEHPPHTLQRKKT